ncbi:hypothetical protein DVK05_09810 [Halorubrum sp. Atlit-8R]|nr:hypothetical protein DVK05_09810 [Halorubrum sp. Atlit-8R]
MRWFTVSGLNNILSADARYQLRLRTVAPDGKTSEWAYADYGNEGNVYFEDDFESGDLSAWDETNLAGDTGVRSGSGGGDLTITGADTGSNYFYGEGEGDDEGTWIQKNLGDLSGESDVLVRCAFAIASLDTPNEDFGISWYDGSSWQPLEHFGSAYNRQGWFEVAALVPSPDLSTDNRIRVGTTTSVGMFSGDHFAVDRVVVSDILHEYTAPAAPSNLSLDASTEREIGLTWENNAAFRDNNYVEFRRSSETDFEYLFNNGGATGVDDTSNTIPRLLDGEEYDVKVQTKVIQNRRGERSSSQFRTRSPVSTEKTVLPAPTNLTVSGVTADSADLAWQASHNYGDTLVQYKPTDAGSWTTYSTVARDTTSATLTGLRNGEAYDARVVASTEHTQTEDDS